MDGCVRCACVSRCSWRSDRCLPAQLASSLFAVRAQSRLPFKLKAPRTGRSSSLLLLCPPRPLPLLRSPRPRCIRSCIFSFTRPRPRTRSASRPSHLSLWPRPLLCRSTMRRLLRVPCARPAAAATAARARARRLTRARSVRRFWAPAAPPTLADLCERCVPLARRGRAPCVGGSIAITERPFVKEGSRPLHSGKISANTAMHQHTRQSEQLARQRDKESFLVCRDWTGAQTENTTTEKHNVLYVEERGQQKTEKSDSHAGRPRQVYSRQTTHHHRPDMYFCSAAGRAHKRRGRHHHHSSLSRPGQCERASKRRRGRSGERRKEKVT